MSKNPNYFDTFTSTMGVKHGYILLVILFSPSYNLSLDVTFGLPQRGTEIN